MLFTRLVIRSRWFNTSGGLLLLILQRTPLLRWIVASDSDNLAPVASLVRSALVTTAAVAGVHTLTGASTYLVANVTLPAQAKVGAAFSMAVAVQGVGVSYALSWDVTNTLPPGITPDGATLKSGKWVINQSAGVLYITGTPTSAGTYTFTIDGWEKANLAGTKISGSTSIVVAANSNTSPSFTTQPVSHTVDPGGSVSFTVAATGTPTPTLQWRHDTVNLPGQTGSTLTLTAVTTADAGSYDCVATNSTGSTASNVATLTLTAPPTFSSQPVDQTVVAGTTVYFTAGATGTPVPTVQWRKNGVNLTGQTGTTLSLVTVSSANAGTYDCVATNSAGSTTSSPAVLVVETAPVITGMTGSETIAYGSPATFTATVSGIPAPTLQWRRDGVTLPGETASTLTLAAVTYADAGTYDLVATNIVASVTGSAAALTVDPPPAPSIITQPIPMRAKSGASAFFSVEGVTVAATFQWRKDGVDLPGATSASLFLSNVQAADAGDYSVHIVNESGAIDSAAAALTVVSSGRARLANLSTRALVGTGDNVLIPGFVLGGSGTKTLLIRVAGPRLLDFGISNALLDPTATLFSGSTTVLTNDNWPDFSDQTLLENTRAKVFAFPFDPSTQDAAMVASLPVDGSSNTVVARGVGDTTGVALVEIYDADSIDDPAHLTNISARARVGAGDNVLIPGFYLDGDVAATLLIRAAGPTLGSFGVNDTLADPVIELFQTLPGGGSAPLTENDDWENAPDLAALNAATTKSQAFPLLTGSADAALLVALNPGGYTVKVSGKNGTSGVALVELYLVEP